MMSRKLRVEHNRRSISKFSPVNYYCFKIILGHEKAIIYSNLLICLHICQIFSCLDIITIDYEVVLLSIIDGIQNIENFQNILLIV